MKAPGSVLSEMAIKSTLEHFSQVPTQEKQSKGDLFSIPQSWSDTQPVSSSSFPAADCQEGQGMDLCSDSSESSCTGLWHRAALPQLPLLWNTELEGWEGPSRNHLNLWFSNQVQWISSRSHNWELEAGESWQEGLRFLFCYTFSSRLSSKVMRQVFQC